MKKLLILLLIATGLSGCGRDYEDILEEMQVEFCKFGDIFASEQALEATAVKLDELREEWRNEIASLSNAERGPAILKSSGPMLSIGLSRCNGFSSNRSTWQILKGLFK
jgi:hypothetical protein